MVVEHVTEATADIWQAQGLHFIDSAGNMYLHWPELIVDIRGRRREPSASSFVMPGRPQASFKSAGLKVV